MGKTNWSNKKFDSEKLLLFSHWGFVYVFYVATILPKVVAAAQIFKTFGGKFKADCFCYISFNLSASPEIKRDVGIKEKY